MVVRHDDHDLEVVLRCDRDRLTTRFWNRSGLRVSGVDVMNLLRAVACKILSRNRFCLKSW